LGSVTIVERVVPFSAVFNFRDLGGYPVADGRTVRWGRVYRSDGLFRLTEGDFATFAALDLRTVLDLRRPDELTTDGRVAEAFGLDYHNVNFHADLWPPHELGPEAMPRYLADRYAEMADSGITGPNPVGSALRLLTRDEVAPLVFHCAAGKDRTGVLAALTLGLLGVADDDIADDYALSAHAERRYQEWQRTLSPDQPEEGGHAPAWVLNPCPREAMLFFLAELRERHGSLEAFIHRAGLGDAEIAVLRDRLLA
jgi:protein-tyrosine phosphatase